MAYRRSRLAHLILYIFVTILCQPLGTPGADVPTTSVNGQITDSESGAPLGSASIRLEGPHHVYGDIADFKGGFSIERVPAGTYRLSVSFIGYKDHVVEALAVSDGPNASIMILLQPDLIYLNPISVTAVRRKERLTDTPAAVVVLDQKQIGSDRLSRRPSTWPGWRTSASSPRVWAERGPPSEDSTDLAQQVSSP